MENAPQDTAAARGRAQHRGGMAIPALRTRAVRSRKSSALVAQSRAELAEDYGTLISLIDRRAKALHELRSEVWNSAIPHRVRTETESRVSSLLEADEASLAGLHRLKQKVHAAGSLAGLTQALRREAEVMRARQAVASGLFVAADWHSPSVDHSVHPNRGPRQGSARLHHDEYKRDRHPDQEVWENEWLREMVDNPSSHQLRALMTASGMAAFTTILAHVEDQVGPGPVLMGAGTYHECRDLLTRSAVGRRIISLPEADPVAWLEALSHHPAAVFLDTMCNAAGLAVPEVGKWLEFLHARGRPVILVLDNTTLSATFQPWRHLPAGSPVRVISFESLTKYAQLGMDRAAGGVVVASTQEADIMDALREHLGTNIADVVVYQHPWPDRRLLEHRLARIGRNAALIAERAALQIAENHGPFQVVYPGLLPASRRDSGFHGGVLAIETTEPDAIFLYRRLIDSILRVAAARGVPICHGTSFGLDTTRMYLTAGNSRSGTPFLRVSAGSEHVLGAQAVADVVAESLSLVR